MLATAAASRFSACAPPSLARDYIQCPPDEDLARWPDERIFEEMRRAWRTPTGRLVRSGRVLDKSLTPMRSFVVEPMQYGRLFLAGDAAHIVTPTGAKGLNLAVADVRLLSRALIEFYRNGATVLLESYSTSALARVWKAQRFSWWMTSMLHRVSRREFLRKPDSTGPSSTTCSRRGPP